MSFVVESAEPERGWLREIRRSHLLAIFAFASAATFVGVQVGYRFIPLEPRHPQSIARRDLVSAFSAWDGQWYANIAAEGYMYAPDEKSSVAFFPLYPMIARVLTWGTGLRVELSLLLISHASNLLGMSLLYSYIRATGQSDDVAFATMLAFAFFPITFFHRMAYSESTFFIIVLAFMYALNQRVHPVVVAVLAGLSTSCRFVGVALVLPVAMHCWKCFRCDSTLIRIARTASVMPLSIWGLAAFMLFQYFSYGDLLAFARTQQYWQDRPVPADLFDWITSKATLSPVLDVYNPTCQCYWGFDPPMSQPAVNLSFLNPLYFIAVFCLICVGYGKHWLSTEEASVAAGLLFVPYFSVAYTNCMASQARFVSVVPAAYIVLGRILHRSPTILRVSYCLLGGALLIAYSALFASWHWYF